MTKEKESGLTKLIELLNEYVEKWNKSDLYYKFELENGELYCYNDVSDVLWTMQDEAMVICSKKYGFIKWLVENEKIEVTNIWRLPKRLYINTDGITCVDDVCEDCYYNAYESLLMLLSIQDEPIEFLISILK